MADSTDGQENGLNMRGAEFPPVSSLQFPDRIGELQKEVEALKIRLKKANKELARYREQDNRSYYDNDYLPYEEDYRE